MFKAVQNLTHYNTRNSVTAEGDAVLDHEPFIHMFHGK